MEKECLIKLTVALYKVTELFPEKEPLRFSVREKATEVLADATLLCPQNAIALTKAQKEKALEQISGNLEVLQGYFEVAKNQTWVRRENFLVLQKEYDKIKQGLREEFIKEELLRVESPVKTQSKSQEKKASPILLQEPPQAKPGPLKKRHKKILDVLKDKTTAQVRDLERILPGVSKRTLRRDFRYLMSQGFVQRIGDGNMTLYKLS